MSININDFCPLNGYIPTITEEGTDWFFVKYVYEALGLDHEEINHQHLLAQSEWAQLTPNYARDDSDIVHLVSESGFYRLVFMSDDPKACRFKDWVLDTVIPAVVEDGMYMMGEEKSFPPPECVFVSQSEYRTQNGTERVFWEHTVSVLLPELRLDGAFFRDIYEVAEMDADPDTMKAISQEMVGRKVARRDHIRSVLQ